MPARGGGTEINMSWTEVTVVTTPEAVEAVSGILYMTNVSGVSIEDPTLIEESNRATWLWDVLDKDVEDRYREEKGILKAYYPNDSDVENIVLEIHEGMERAKEYVNVGNYSISHRIVEEEDWENSWKKYYKPVKVGKNILIKPVWEETPQNGEIVIELDPGMAFGSGTHETTRMCLKLLEEYIKSDSSVLDIGTGSGILSIGAAKLGASDIKAVDIDSVAVKVAKENAKLNKVEDKIDISCGNLTEKISGKYDIVIANIIADAIITLSADASKFLKSDGIYITSGIIEHRIDDVKKALTENGFNIIHIERERDWAAIVCKKD